MNERTIIARLAWKDIMAIKSLLLAAAVGMVVINLLIFFMARYHGQPGVAADPLPWAITWWIIIPNLVALGAPAMLVGNEEETGTLGWLRTLPIRWQWIVASKFGVAFGAVLATWIAASIVLWLQSFAWNEATYPDAKSLISVNGISIVGFHALSLLSLGFVFAYLIRSPLMALLSLVPAFIVYLILMANLGDYFFQGDAQTISGRGVWLGISIFSALGLCQLWLARRRLLLPLSTIALGRKSESMSDYRAPVLRFASRPTPIGSLLWQQVRQTGPLCVTLVGVSMFLSVIFGVTIERGLLGSELLGGLSPLFLFLCASWFGAVVFYGDNVHGRRAFFADRGISPTRVWWTRVAPPAVGFMLTWLLVVLISLSLSQDEWRRIAGGGFLDVVVLASVMFAFGQLVSQWSERPLLAFLAAPAYTVISLSPLLYLLDRLRSDFTVVALTIPVLLLATWQLTGRWMEGRVKGGYTVRVLAYTAVAVLIPCLWVGADYLRSHQPMDRQFTASYVAPQNDAVRVPQARPRPAVIGGVNFQLANVRQAGRVPHVTAAKSDEGRRAVFPHE